MLCLVYFLSIVGYMGKTITLRRGYDIKLKGQAKREIAPHTPSTLVAVKPSDWPQVKPKILVKAGDIIQAGDVLFTDKILPDLKFTSPVSGEIAEIVLGEKRRLLEIRILRDKAQTSYRNFTRSNPSSLTREQIIEQLLESGCWPYIRQRPYSIIASPGDSPKGIFISMFDTAPLAPDIDFVLSREPQHFQTGLDVLNVLAPGNIYLSFHGHHNNGKAPTTYGGIKDDHIYTFKGPHPAGNVGIQIHHIDPVQKGDIAWYIHPQDVIIIGRLFHEGRYRADRTIALTGSSLQAPCYVQATSGEQIVSLLEQLPENDNVRIIQGNVLHGSTSARHDFLSYYTNQLTVIPEGNKPEFLGWLLPGTKKLSLSRTFISWLLPHRTYELDTNTHGEERAFVMTGQYDKVLPMNIYPVYLLKAILAQDIEKMEALGIYEVAEEDFALCEFVCTSKINVQQIISEGIQLMLEEG